MESYEKKPAVGIILGSSRPGRICPEIADWARNRLENDRLDWHLIDLAEINLPFLDEAELPARHHYQKEHTIKWSETIKNLDGFIFVFPQYNWGYPAVLKNALDYLYDEWSGKPVSFICYGGHGGFQAALGMRLVTQGLNMNNMSTSLSLTIEKEMFDESMKFKDIESALKQYEHPLGALSEEFIHLLVK